MNPAEDIKHYFQKSTLSTNADKHEQIFEEILRAQHLTKTTPAPPVNICRVIMRSNITKLAAAIILAASLLYFTFISNQSSWADVVHAINNADNVHIITKATRSNGEIDIKNFWLKNKKMYREEELDGDGITIDDGVNCLNIDVKNKTAKFIDSKDKDYYMRGVLGLVLLFNGEAPRYLAEALADDYKTEEIPEEHTDTERVFEITFHDSWTGKVWINKKTNLPRYIYINPIEKDRQSALYGEITFDYQTIPMEKFHFNIPEDYKIRSRIVKR